MTKKKTHSLQVKGTTLQEVLERFSSSMHYRTRSTLENQNHSPRTSGRRPPPRATPTSTKSRKMNQV
eukprot:12883673-Prorocentrum_lima.AAC.1